MRKFTLLALTGLAVAGLTLATPAISRADHRRGGSLSLSIGNGFQLDYNRGYGRHFQGSGYGGYYNSGYGGYYNSGYGGYCAPQPTIVVPSYDHWTPYRGWHTHGQILVPHRGHYHVRPY